MSASFYDQNEPDTTHELFESFAAPRTVPAGWDLSELISTRNGGSARAAGTALTNTDAPATGDPEPAPPTDRERFPKPNTYPSQWNLSG